MAESRYGNQPKPEEADLGQSEPATEPGEERRRGGCLKFAAVLGVSALSAAAGAGWVAKEWLEDNAPRQVASAEDSRMQATTLAIEPTSFDCRSYVVFGHDGSTARTKYAIGDNRFEFTGYGATMTKGRSVLEACAPEVDIDTQVTGSGSDQRTDVFIGLSSMRFDSHFNDADTEIVRQDPEVTQFGGGLLDAGSAGLEVGCNILSLGQAQEQCDAVNLLSDWNATNQAKLQTATRVAVLTKTQEECAPLEWENQKLAIEDSYREQADAQGFDPYSVNVWFVDDNGELTEAVPDFTKSTLEALYEKGVLSKEAAGAPDLVFENVTCTQMEGGYQPKYPDPVSQ